MILGLVAAETVGCNASKPNEATAPTPLWPLDPSMLAEMSTLKLTKEEESCELRKEQGTWSIQAPLRASANPVKLKAFMAQLTSVLPKIQHPVAEPQPAWGLNSPAARIVGADAAGVVHFELSFGALNSSEQTVYTSLKVAGGTPSYFSLPRLMAYRLGLGLDDLREKRILPLAGLKNFTLSYAHRGLERDRFSFEAVQKISDETGKKSFMQLTQPVVARADQRRIDRLLRFLMQTEVSAIITEDHQHKLASWGLDAPEWFIQVQTEDPPSNFQISITRNPKKRGELLVATSTTPWIGRIPVEKIDLLSCDLNDVIDKRLFGFSMSKVHRWEIDSEAFGHVVLERNNGEFSMLAPQPAVLHDELVNRALASFARLEGTRLVPKETEPYELHLPKAQKNSFVKMRFLDRNAKELDALWVYRTGEGRLLGLPRTTPRVLELSMQGLKSLPPSIEVWIKY